MEQWWCDDWQGKQTELGDERGVKPLHHLRNGDGRLSLTRKHEVRTKCRGWRLREMKLFKVKSGGGGKKTEMQLAINNLRR
jgi:hypothetical protein